MRRAITILLALVLALSLATVSFAASDEATNAANELNKLGLFNGVGTNADGTPNYDLDRAPTRNEAITMLVRLLGKEDEAKQGAWDTPFTDVADWAKPYVGYAYANKLTSGTSDTTFGGDALVSATQYLTFVLRALGYDSSIDFRWDAAWELSDSIGITQGEYNASSAFMRGDVAIISFRALDATLKGSNSKLLQALGIVESDISLYDYLVQFVKTNGKQEAGVYSFNLFEDRDALKVNEFHLCNLVYDDNAQELRFEVILRTTEDTFCMVEYEGKRELTYLWSDSIGTLICPSDFKDYSKYSFIHTSYTPAYTEYITSYSEDLSRTVCNIIRSGNQYDVDIIESDADFNAVVAGMNVGAMRKDLEIKTSKIQIHNICVAFANNKSKIFNGNDYAYYENEIPDFFAFFSK